MSYSAEVIDLSDCSEAPLPYLLADVMQIYYSYMHEYYTSRGIATRDIYNLVARPHEHMAKAKIVKCMLEEATEFGPQSSPWSSPWSTVQVLKYPGTEGSALQYIRIQPPQRCVGYP